MPVLPREVAAVITTSAMARAAWAIAACMIAFTLARAIVILPRENPAFQPLPAVLPLLAMLALLYLASSRPTRITLALYLVGGGLCVYLFLLSVLSQVPSMVPDAVYFLNRPALALVLVGTATARPFRAVYWGLGGYVAGVVATVAASGQAGVPLVLGFGPTLALVSYAAVFSAIAIVQRAGRGKVPDISLMESETRIEESKRAANMRAIALVHDTVLNDLALAMNAPRELDARTRARMLKDVDTLLTTDLLGSETAPPVADERDAAFRNGLATLVSDFQWRGLTVDFSGEPEAVRLSASSTVAALGAVQACLENVLAHSQVNSAEVILARADNTATIMVVDSGVGFDPASVGSDRLGLRTSIIQRVESCGGSVRLWSTPGFGTSVLISLPLDEDCDSATVAPQKRDSDG